MKTNLIILSFIIALIIMGYIVINSCPSLSLKYVNDISNGVKSDNVTVYIKNNKFVPDIITIKEGASVTLVNSDDKSHTIIARNSLKYNVLKSSEFYTYTFLESGEFGFYSKYYPALKGKVIVVK